MKNKSLGVMMAIIAGAIAAAVLVPRHGIEVGAAFAVVIGIGVGILVLVVTGLAKGANKAS